MSTKPPALVREIIDLLSSSPPPRLTPVPAATARRDESPFMSSPLPPLPSVMFNVLAERAAAAKAREIQENKATSEKVTALNIPDDAGKVEFPPLATGRKQTPEATSDTRAKKPRARKPTKVEKAAPLKDRKLKSRVIKNAMARTGTKSKLFTEHQEQNSTEAMVENHLDISVMLNPASRKASLVPKSPNRLPAHLEPPLHVIRRQWTPVKNTVLTLDSSSPLVNGEPKVTRKIVFSSIVSSMRYSTEPAQDSREVCAGMEDCLGNGLTNKRAIEIIGLPSAAASKDRPPKPLKPKLSKAKPRTITDHATASYRSAPNPTASPILQFFSPQGETSISTEDTETQVSLSRKPGPPAKKKRKSDPETVTLLSPTSARKRFDDQEFVFGTCSQLEKTDGIEAASAYSVQPRVDLNRQSDHFDGLPPVSTSVVRRDFLKALAKDRKGGSLLGGSRKNEQNGVSAGYDDDVYVSAICQRERTAGGGGSRLSKLWGTESGLWGAAARDLEGGLMDIEVVDMTGSENGYNNCLAFGIVREEGYGGLLKNSAAATGTQVIGRPALQNDTDESRQSIRQEAQIIDPVQAMRNLRDNPWAASSSTTGLNASLVAPLGKPANLTAHKTKLINSSAGLGTRSRSISSRASCATASSTTPVRTNPTLNPLVAPTAMGSIQVKPAPAAPDFQSYPTAQLKAEVAKFGFKNMRTRDRMVACLERCWEAQNRIAGDLTHIRNTAEPTECTTREETEPILHLQEDITAPSQKPKAPTKRKKAVDKAAAKPPKSPKRKAASSRSKSSSKKTPPPSGSDYDAPKIASPSAKPRSPKKKAVLAPKPKTRKRSVPPPSPQPKAANLHFRISKVIRESDGAKSEFSFYHAILMYDPVVLEDLTRWLNMHMEERVDVEDVKTWCETNGICCVRSESLRGKQRKRR